jgi:hypothetical protein
MNYNDHIFCIAFVSLGIICNIAMSIENNDSKVIGISKKTFINVLQDIINGGENNNNKNIIKNENNLYENEIQNFDSDKDDDDNFNNNNNNNNNFLSNYNVNNKNNNVYKNNFNTNNNNKNSNNNYNFSPLGVKNRKKTTTKNDSFFYLQKNLMERDAKNSEKNIENLNNSYNNINNSIDLNYYTSDENDFFGK